MSPCKPLVEWYSLAVRHGGGLIWRSCTLRRIVFLGLGLNGFVASVVDAQPNQPYKGGKCMTSNEIVEALRKPDATPESVSDGLSRNVEEQARGPVRAAVTLVNDPDPKIFAKAAQLLSDIGDLAILPLLESPEPRAVPVKLWRMETVLAAHLAVRDRIVAGLDAMLADKTLISWGRVGPVEQVRPPTRVCDEAYIMMRRLLNAAEGKADSIQERRAFLALSDDAKDAEIRKARDSRAWSHLVGHDD